MAQFPGKSFVPALIQAHEQNLENYQGIPHPKKEMGERNRMLQTFLTDLHTQLLQAIGANLGFDLDHKLRSIVRERLLDGSFPPSWNKYADEIGRNWLFENFSAIFSANPADFLSPLFLLLTEAKPAEILSRIEELASLKLMTKEEITSELPYEIEQMLENS